MKNKLNWQKTKQKAIFQYLLLFICWGLFIACPTMVIYGQVQVPAKIKSKEFIENDSLVKKHAFFIAEERDDDDVVDWPCGDMFAISVEDDRYVFNAMSSMMATAIDDNTILLPDGTEISGKTSQVPPKETQTQYTYEEINNRILGLRVGYHETPEGVRWSIMPEDMEKHYPDNIYDIVLDNKESIAFNPENVFYEMLVTIQKQSEQIANLELRLGQIEDKADIKTNSALENNNSIRIATNPIESNELKLEYQLDPQVRKASLLITNMTGQVLETLSLNDRGFGYTYIDLELSAGVYLCTLLTDERVGKTQKFVVQ